MIHFNEPILLENALTYVREAIHNKKLSGDGEFTKRCSYWLGKWCGTEHVFLTTSCTHATEMAAILAGISPGDEVIMPAYTFVSTADAFVLRGAKVKFVDIRPDTMNMDEMLIENAITKRTKAIIPVHYAGVGCEMDAIMDVAKRHHLLVIEDAAQGVMSTYKGQALGAIGDYGCYSFHETKNYSMGEGGAIVVKNKEKVELAEIIREKGTNRSKYFRGQIDKYTWVEAGSSYLPSELNAAYLWAQLEQAEEIFQNRMKTWNMYQEGLQRLEESGRLQLPFIPTECVHNAHMFYIKTESLGERTELISFMKSKGINLAFHYVPLHTAPAGIKYGEFIGEDRYTTAESERLVRLPLYYGIKEIDVERVIDNILMFYLDRGGYAYERSGRCKEDSGLFVSTWIVSFVFLWRGMLQICRAGWYWFDAFLVFLWSIIAYFDSLCIAVAEDLKENASCNSLCKQISNFALGNALGSMLFL